MQTSFGNSLASMQSRLGFVLLVAIAMVLAGATVASAQGASQHAHDPAPGKKSNSPLVDKVRAATAGPIPVQWACTSSCPAVSAMAF